MIPAAISFGSLAAGSAAAEYSMMGPVELFTLLFIVLGPLKLLGPFLHKTRSMERAELRALALRATAIATAGILAGGFVGRALLANWNIDSAILLLSVGLIFFVVAFRLVMQPYEASRGAAPADASPAPARVLEIAFPLVAPPYGVGAVILLLAVSESHERTALVCGMVLAILLLDLLAMVFVRSLMKPFGLALLQVLVAVLGVLQVALAARILLMALWELGVLSRPGPGG